MSQHSSPGWTSTEAPDLHPDPTLLFLPRAAFSLQGCCLWEMPQPCTCPAGKASAAAMVGAFPAAGTAWEQLLCACWVRICLHWHSSSGPAQCLEGVTVQPQRSPWPAVRKGSKQGVSSSEKSRNKLFLPQKNPFADKSVSVSL